MVEPPDWVKTAMLGVLMPIRRSDVVVFVPPLVQLLIFGYAVNLDVENTPIAWMDRDNTPASRSLLNAFKSSRYFRFTMIR